ncbi:MAG TPA: VCBS repeat-containing protein [Candidatus Acidoferrales bacterium]|nr:VCBS repeat-containing protein [Candidatus Acidoferrales bacterium]
MGVAVGDYDNDGFEDFCVTAYGGNKLYHNNGNGTFTDVTEKADVAGGGWSTSALLARNTGARVCGCFPRNLRKLPCGKKPAAKTAWALGDAH